MVTGPNRTAELLEHFIDSKRNLADTLVSKGEEASFDEPFDTLVQKAGDYIPKSYIFVDPNGNEIPGVLTSQEVVFDATENDVREGKIFVSDTGVKTGEKFIPSYVVSEGYVVILPNTTFAITKLANLYDYTKLQALICPYVGSVPESVSTEKIAIDTGVYAVNSTKPLATIQKDSKNQHVNFTIINESESRYLLRYFTYKEII